jgi:cobalamin biosynthetic protein CobC
VLEHGGRLGQAAARYGIPQDRWLDLSTGINPQGWPVPPLPADVWQRLPQEDDGLERAAARYFACDSLLPVAGSQAAIQALPRLFPTARVGVLQPGYAEHPWAWKQAGHRVEALSAGEIDKRLAQLQVLVLCRPNNPDGLVLEPQQLLAWHRRLHARGGWLVLDEAFIDPTPELSLAGLCPRPGLIVLRSLGKFFGLAGLRVGFVLAQSALLHRLREWLGPWHVSGPARVIAEAALNDLDWQQQTRKQLHLDGQRLAGLLKRTGLPPCGGTSLFQFVPTAAAAAIHQALARQGVLLRLFEQLPALRVGLPGSESCWQRLEQALEHPSVQRLR